MKIILYRYLASRVSPLSFGGWVARYLRPNLGSQVQLCRLHRYQTLYIAVTLSLEYSRRSLTRAVS